MTFLQNSGGDCGEVCIVNALKLMGYTRFDNRNVNRNLVPYLRNLTDNLNDEGCNVDLTLEIIADAAWEKGYTVEQVYGSLSIDLITRTLKREGFCVLTVRLPNSDYDHVFMVKGYKVTNGNVTFDTLWLFADGNDHKIKLDDLRWIMKNTPRDHARLCCFYK